MSKCLWCGVSTDRPIRSALTHFKLYQSGQWRYFKGNMATFGKWDGFWATIGLISPLWTSLRHWRYRKSHLTL